MAVFYRWIAAQFVADRTLNEFARDLVAARGRTYVNPPANFWRAVRDTLLRAEAVAQVFLGVRVACARLHNHTYERCTIDDYYGFVALLARLDHLVGDNQRCDILDKHESVGEQVVWQKRDGEVTHGRTKHPAAPRLLGANSSPLAADADRLTALAD